MVGVSRLEDMTTFWITTLLLVFIKNSASEFNPSICSILEESCGVIPPPLPRNFEMKAEHVDNNAKYASYEEIYFDYSNLRAKYKYLLDTIEYHYLFDYDTQQVVQWMKVHPGISMKRDPLSHSCEAVELEDSDHAFLFGYQDSFYRGPKMYNSFQVLRYGGEYPYAANGTETLDERALKVNKFVGCVYDKSIGATLLNDYYFADTEMVQPSGGTPSTVVTGPDDKPLSVPVKLHITGGYFEDGKSTLFNKTISISWFKGDPEFRDETFQIPPWIHCENYRGRKEIPKLPTAFSTRVVITWHLVDELGQLEPQTSGESYEEIYYDQEKRLARRDFTPSPSLDTEIINIFKNYAPVSTIYDFNEGIRYAINKPSGRCYITPIKKNEFFDAGGDSIYMKMGTPEEIFLMQMDDMEYKGTAFARDIQCDVWNGKHYHEQYDATFVKETYFSTNGWHENVEGVVERRVPVKNVLIKKELDGEVAEGISTYNFLRFRNSPPKMASFDIQNCVEQIDHKRFAIELTLNGDISEKVFKYKFLFLEAAQVYIANKSEVHTPLRVQRLHLRHQSISSSRVFLIFSLLEKANLNRLPLPVGQAGKSLEDAIFSLQTVVDGDNFAVQFKDPNGKEEITVRAGRGSLYALTADDYQTPLPPQSVNVQHSEDDENVKIVTSDEHKGMTSGHLTLLAFAMLFIGIGIGIAIMYLYLRIYAERHVEDRVELAQSASPTAKEDLTEIVQQQTP